MSGLAHDCATSSSSPLREVGDKSKRKVSFIRDNGIQVNEAIREKELRVIGPDGEQYGVLSRDEALRKAEDLELDLIKIGGNQTPPVCKIADFGKYLYEKERKEKENKKNQKQQELKELRMTPNIDTNDLNTKISAARKFIEKGHKIKVTLRFRGREMTRTQSFEHVLTNFAEQLKDVAVIEKGAKTEGRNMSIVIAPKK